MARNTTLGEYFENAPGGDPMSGLGDYFDTTPGGELTGLGARNVTPVGRSPDGLGRLSDLSPFVRDLRRWRRRHAVGQAPPDTATDTVVVESPGPSPSAIAAGVIIGLGVRGAAGYLVGRELAPSADRETKYAWWGVAASIFLGTLGLGVQAVVAHRNR